MTQAAVGMGKTQHTEKLTEPEKGVGASQRKEVRRRNLKENSRILPWASGPLYDVGNTRWTIHKLQLVVLL